MYNGVAQAIPGQLICLLALGTLGNEREAKHIILTRNGIHPKLHEVDTSTTKITFYVGIELETPIQWQLREDNLLACRPTKDEPQKITFNCDFSSTDDEVEQ